MRFGDRHRVLGLVLLRENGRRVLLLSIRESLLHEQEIYMNSCGVKGVWGLPLMHAGRSSPWAFVRECKMFLWLAIGYIHTIEQRHTALPPHCPPSTGIESIVLGRCVDEQR